MFAQAIIYSSIFYSMGSFIWTVDRFIWYLFFMYFTMLYFTFYGMMTTAITPNHNVAAIIAAPFYMLWNLFSGFMIPRKVWKLILHCYLSGVLQINAEKQCNENKFRVVLEKFSILNLIFEVMINNIK